MFVMPSWDNLMAKKQVVSFDSYYSEMYKERWQSLRASLLAESVYAALMPRDVVSSQPWLYPWLSLHTASHQEAYYLDPASAWAACQLPLNPGDQVLDMCAAPGGKSLVLYNRLEPGSTLLSNDIHMTRASRLAKVMAQFKQDDSWKMSRQDGAMFGLRQKEHFDAILVDAPCSSERHWLQKDGWLADWRPSRSKRLALAQWCLLASACDALKVGGHILYLTCALSDLENDGVIDKALKKRRVCVKPVDNTFESTRHGFMILPDISNGWGPIYGCLLQKIDV